MKKIAIMVATLLVANSSFSQETPSKPAHKISYGFSVGTNYSMLYLGEIDPSKAALASAKNGLGVRLGVLGELPLSSRLSLTAKPEICLNNNSVGYFVSEVEAVSYKMPNTAELAVHLSYKLWEGATQPYVLIGTAYKHPLMTAALDDLEISKSIFALDAGLGLEHLFKHFNIAPELRYSYNLNNLSSIDGIKNVRYHVLTLVLAFKN